MLRQLMLSAIKFYQRYLSPYKGFCCAYRAYTGHASCSHLGYRSIRRYGVWRGLAVLRRRTWRCGVAHRRYNAARYYPLAQRGFCDIGCDAPCDLPDFSCNPDAQHLLNPCLDYCSPCDACDGFSRKKRNQTSEALIYLPPNNKPPHESSQTHSAPAKPTPSSQHSP